ncbi:MAG: 50S ribosomal protein L33 [Candidatus Anoxychlamydiales bacterium]|nr:50S ribosomal protein L33 [Candidatus Anoxychlamydiales bacterium]
MAKKKEREIIKLKNSETKECYWTVKNKKNTTDKLERKKYSKKLRKHIVFKEAK